MTHQRIRTGHWPLRRWACSCGIARWSRCPDRCRSAAVAVVPMGDLTW